MSLCYISVADPTAQDVPLPLPMSLQLLCHPVSIVTDVQELRKRLVCWVLVGFFTLWAYWQLMHIVQLSLLLMGRLYLQPNGLNPAFLNFLLCGQGVTQLVDIWVPAAAWAPTVPPKDSFVFKNSYYNETDLV